MEVKSFRAYRFNKNTVVNPGGCVAPPYDVIDSAMQDELYRRNEYNIVRAIKGRTEAGDSSDNNVYTRAAAYLQEAINSGALTQEDSDSIYAYVQDFQIAGQSFERSGIIACGKLSVFGEGVQPHEKTLEGPKADRLNLTRATACQLGQIFMLYDDPTNVDSRIITKAMQNKPVIDMTDEHDVETALNYWSETQNGQAAYQMLTFVNMRNEGLVIQPTHRLLVDMDNFDLTALLEELKDEFEITEFAFNNDTERRQARRQMFEMMGANAAQNIFGLYAGTKAFYAIKLKGTK
ncbi:MAG: DUF1015 family protein, partial [Planctomycetota bacterium]